ncbi:site-specific integrase, partial [Gulosibacter macacae]
AAAMEEDIRVGRYVRPEDAARTFGEVAEEWFASKHKIKGSTKIRYRRELDTYVLPRWRDVRLEHIGETSINEWVGQLREGKAVVSFKVKSAEKAKPLGASMIHHVVGVVFGAVLRDAVDRNLIQRSPLARVELPKPDSDIGERLYLTVEQVEQLAAGAQESKGGESALIVRTLAYTGLRIGELAALRVGDLDASGKRLRVSRTLTIDENGIDTEGSPKGGKSRKVPVPTFLLGDLKALAGRRPSNAPLFRTTRGAQLNVNNWRNREWTAAVATSGLDELEGLTIHTLRHTYASIAIRAGADVKTLQAVLGHATAVETLETYAGLWPERLDEVADAIELTRVADLEKAKSNRRDHDAA